MALFNRNFNKPGPGVAKDEPRKKGIRRFFEVLGRDFGGLVKLNLLFFACCVPSLALYIVGMLNLGGNASVVLLVLALVAAAPIGGAVTAGYYCISKMLQDRPGFIWHDFQRKFKENWLLTLPVGIVCTLIVYVQVYFLLVLAGNPGSDLGLETVIFIMSWVIFGMVSPYFFLQAGYLTLKTGALLKNSFLLAFGNGPRSLMGMLCGSIIWACIILFIPASLVLLPLLPLFAFSLSWLLTLMWIWKPVDAQFQIEETLRAKDKEALAGVTDHSEKQK